MSGDAREVLQAIGMKKGSITRTLKNESLTSHIVRLCEEGDVAKGCATHIGNMIYEMATQWPPRCPPSAEHIVLQLVVQEKVKTSTQMKEALSFLSRLGVEEEVDVSALEECCGVGVEVSEEQITSALEQVLLLDDLRHVMYSRSPMSAFGRVMSALRERLPWLDQRLTASLVKKRLSGLSREDVAPSQAYLLRLEEQKRLEEEEKAQQAQRDAEAEEEQRVTLSESVRFHRPEENTQKRPELLQAHLEATGGAYVTRFPPEPNGYLHIGHVKSMNLNFGYAKRMQGHCIMRFDDTNPSSEKQEYVDSILDCVKWMNYEPVKVTYSSDYFPQLFELAIQLIKKGKAYVCHQTPQQMEESRQLRTNSPFRDRPIEENLRLFHDMRKGKFGAGEAVLRMKQDMQSDNPNMRDLVAYRIIYKAHPHVGDKWCIYPSYDYTHCIVDSLENITHSLCTLEFQTRNETYRWLLDALDVYCPPQIEFSRLNLTGTVLSKRKLIRLVEEGHVSGWDDPRMPTMMGLRRRGYTPQGLSAFAESLGLSKSHNFVQWSMLEHHIREHLDTTSRRAMCVLQPLKVTITNWSDHHPNDSHVSISLPDFPALKGASAQHEVWFSSCVYIDRSDWGEDADDASFYGLCPGRTVRLRGATVIRCDSVERDASGEPTEVRCTMLPTYEGKKKLKGTLTWVCPSPGHHEPTSATVRLFEALFSVDFPGQATGNYLDDINPNSLTVVHNAFVDASCASLQPLQRLQFERVGFFCVDLSSTSQSLVFNRTVHLHDTKKVKQLSKKETKA